ncbi:alpha/beta hydrolase [Duganella sp. Dugasp56]|uniref:RBBP9/YdeN family alpha/beta hydrolase n=1 Tax=Duganella sp. Dugasp56 TaxID=3243046 RepID=UPI00159DB6E1
MDGVLSQFRVLIAPGLHGSGPEHWQSRWQRLFPAFERIEQDDWDVPDLPRWSARVDRQRRAVVNTGDHPRPLLIVAHSFGSLAAVHSVARDPAGVAGLLLVAPADPDKFNVAALLPKQALPVPSVMVGSTDDPWMAAPRAELWARHWHSRFINGGPLGHINAESGLGDWPEGLEILYFLAEKAQNNALTAH